ncbi:MAG: ABC transporter ATP-binding protein, partial [bacterium]
YLPPHRRNCAMVFQNYALFPHMTLFENVAFGLRARKTTSSEIRDRVARVLDLVDLGNYTNRKVTELSGGQQQRVALARALVIEPNILLLDEPLSNLDARLREETRGEISALQKRLGITTIYVTHDQQEALALSDRIAVMNQGQCHQVGTPAEIYLKPNDRFVASFVGNSNILEGTLTQKTKSTVQVEIKPGWHLEIHTTKSDTLAERQTVSLGLRPENILFVNGREAKINTVEGTIQTLNYAGATIDYKIEVRGMTLRVKRQISENDRLRKVGDKIRLQLPPGQIALFE